MRQMPKYLGDSLTWLAYTICGIAVPFLISFIIIEALKLVFSLHTLTGNGQFALYSAAMCSTTLYIITKPSQRSIPHTVYFGLLTFVALPVAAAFFVVSILSSNGVSIASWIIEWPTIALFLCCLTIAFFAILSDNKKASIGRVEFDKMNDASYGELDKEFDKETKRGAKK